MRTRRTALAIVLFLTSIDTAFAKRPPAHPVAPDGVTASDVLSFEKNMEAAIVRGDTTYMDRILASDFRFTHGDGWTTGGKALAVDDKAAFLARVAGKQYRVHDIVASQVEMHGEVAITYGKYVSQYQGRWNAVWFERVYARRDGEWTFLSHRTVHGPTSGPDRASVSDK